MHDDADPQASATDPIARAMGEWGRIEPGADADAMEVVLRLARLGERISAEVGAVHRAAGLEPGDFDVLATLLRRGPSAPTVLARELLLSKAGMSGRIARLRERGLIEEAAREDDRRGKSIALSTRGEEIVRGLVVEHSRAEARALEPLSAAQRAALLELLRAAWR